MEDAISILQSNCKNAYFEALNVLHPDSLKNWKKFVKLDEYHANKSGLLIFLKDIFLPACITQEKQAFYHSEIKAQTIGEGAIAAQLEQLSRYETQLDRKLVQSLATLLKLQDLRSES